jgi:hypothetical protein
MAYQKYKVSGTTAKDEVWLYADADGKANWEYFFTGTLTPDTGGLVDKNLSIRSFTRHRGPGDSGYTVKASGRRYARMPQSKGSNRPGWVLTVIADLGTPGQESREFRIQGSWLDVKNMAKAKVKYETVIRNTRGWAAEFPAAAGGGTMAAQQAAGNLQPAIAIP